MLMMGGQVHDGLVEKMFCECGTLECPSDPISRWLTIASCLRPALHLPSATKEDGNE